MNIQKIILPCLLLASSLSLAQTQNVVPPTAPPTSAPGVYIKVGEAKVKKSVLALPVLLHTGNDLKNTKSISTGAELYNIILNDLEISGYFQFVKKDAYPEDVSKLGLKPAPGEPSGFTFDKWKQIGSDFLIRAGYRIVDQEIVLDTYLYSVSQAKLIQGRSYRVKSDQVRKIAHTFANDVIEALTGKPGFFLSKIVATSDRAGNKWREIYTMDWDGANPDRVTQHKSITVSPAWHPSGDSVAYTAYAFHSKSKQRNADLFSYDLKTGKRFLLSSRIGINSGAAYFPNGKNLLITLSQSGNPDIYKMDENGENLVRITNGPLGAMNVEPAISPDGNKIAFSSDRSGKPMIYTMDASGGSLKRMTFIGKYNASPAWSPDGKKIAFAGWEASHFDIFIMNADGTGMERLVSAKKSNGRAANSEDPVFSPDGRLLMYTSNRSGVNQIYVVNIDSKQESKITADRFNYYKPKWLAEK